MAEVTRPGKSSRCSRDVSFVSSMKIRAATTPATPTGMLMKKIQLQLMSSVSNPLTRRKSRGDDRERRRIHERRTDALHRACRDQRFRSAGESAPERGTGEDHEAGDEDGPASEQVGELAPAQKKDAERQG